MTASAMTIPSPEELVNQWLQSLEADGHARGTIRRYKSVALSFLSWYEREEGRSLHGRVLNLKQLQRHSGAARKEEVSPHQQCDK